MRIAIGCDHIVTDIKNKLRDYLISKNHEVIDVGTYDFTRTHYPIFGKRVADEIINNNCDFGVVICGTGVGISNATQKNPKIRAVLVEDLITAKFSRKYYDANVIAFGGRVLGIGVMEEALDIFIDTKFEGDKKLVDYLDSLILKDKNKDEYFSLEQKKWRKGKYHD